MSEYVRNNDPIESHIAASAIQGTIDHDRMIVLRSFSNLGKATYREAAKYALRNVKYDTERLESLRRRGSDLKKLGMLIQIGKHQGQAEFKLTEEGKVALHASKV